MSMFVLLKNLRTLLLGGLLFGFIFCPSSRGEDVPLFLPYPAIEKHFQPQTQPTSKHLSAAQKKWISIRDLQSRSQKNVCLTLIAPVKTHPLSFSTDPMPRPLSKAMLTPVRERIGWLGDKLNTLKGPNNALESFRQFNEHTFFKNKCLKILDNKDPKYVSDFLDEFKYRYSNNLFLKVTDDDFYGIFYQHLNGMSGKISAGRNTSSFYLETTTAVVNLLADVFEHYNHHYYYRFFQQKFGLPSTWTRKKVTDIFITNDLEGLASEVRLFLNEVLPWQLPRVGQEKSSVLSLPHSAALRADIVEELDALIPDLRLIDDSLELSLRLLNESSTNFHPSSVEKYKKSIERIRSEIQGLYSLSLEIELQTYLKEQILSSLERYSKLASSYPGATMNIDSTPLKDLMLQTLAWSQPVLIR